MPRPVCAPLPARRRRLIVGVIAGLGHALVLLAVFHRVWWGEDGGRLFFGWDCLREYWQDILFPLNALRDGELPLWNPYALGGYSFIGDPQSGLLSPVNWLCWLLATISGSEGAWLIQVKVLVNLWLGLLGMHLLAHRRTGSHVAGVVAATVCVLGSPLLVHKNGAFLWPFLYLPWAVIALERFVEQPTLRRGAVLAAGIWLCGSAGHPQGFFYDLVILSAYWCFLTLAPLRQALASLRRQALGGAACLGMTALLLLPIYWPASAAVAQSPRAERGLTYVLQQPLPPGGLKELLIPNLDANWMLDIYIGPAALLLGLFSVIAARRWSARAPRLFWLGMALFGLFLSMGEHTPLLPFMAEHVPGFDLFRIAYRHKLIFGFCIAVAAGDGLGALARDEAPVWLRWVFVILSGAWIGSASLAGLGKAPALASGRAADAALLALATGGPALLLLSIALFHRRRQGLYLWLGAALVLADLWTAGGSKIRIMQPPPKLADARQLVGSMKGVGRSWRYHKADYPPATNTSSILEVREFSGYWSLPTRLKLYHDVLARSLADPTLLRHYNVRWLVSRRPLHHKRIGPLVYELPDATPLLRVYGRAERVPAGRVLARISQTGGRVAAVVAREEQVPPLPSSSFSPVDGELLRYRRNEIVLRVKTPGPGIAVLNEAFFPGWQAEVNGRPVPIFRANHLLRAVVVPSGESELRFHYAPGGYIAALLLFLVGLALVVLALSPWGRLLERPSR